TDSSELAVKPRFVSDCSHIAVEGTRRCHILKTLRRVFQAGLLRGRFGRICRHSSAPGSFWKVRTTISRRPPSQFVDPPSFSAASALTQVFPPRSPDLRAAAR